jgi:predicted RNA methylase
MTISKDPEGNETATLHAMVDFKDCHVLEIGCGEGRLTWGYADRAAHVTAIDPDGEAIEIARANLLASLEGRVDFIKSSLEEFAASHDRKFDIAIFAWSL